MSPEKVHNLKSENYVLFLGGLPEDSNPGGSFSDSSEGLLQRGKGGSRIYKGFVCLFFATKTR